MTEGENLLGEDQTIAQLRVQLDRDPFFVRGRSAGRLLTEYDRRGEYVTELAGKVRAWSELAEQYRARLAEMTAELSRLHSELSDREFDVAERNLHPDG